MNDINVIYQFNEKYAPYAGVSITSVLANNIDATVNVYVLGEGLSDGSMDLLCQTVSEYGGNICFPDTSALLARFRSLGMIPYRGAYSVYLRLFFTELDELSSLAGQRAIYLDSDTIVDNSLLPLAEYDLAGKSIGMVLESIRDDYKVMIGLSPTSDYYNSGVILFDVDRWRDNKYCEKLIDHITNVRSSYIGDQDFLNIVCEGDVCTLPLKYNFQPLHGRYSIKQYFGAYGNDGYYSAKEIEEAHGDTAIFHCYRWLGEFPWNRGNLHPFKEHFDKYLKKSLWKSGSKMLIKENADLSFALTMEKWLYRILPRVVFIRIFKFMHELVLRHAENDARHQKASDVS